MAAKVFGSDIVNIEEVHNESETEVLRVTLKDALPEDYEVDHWTSNNLLALRNTTYGGFWRIVKIQPYDRRIVDCEIPKICKLTVIPKRTGRWYTWEVDQYRNTDPEFFRTEVYQGLQPGYSGPQGKPTALLLQPRTVMSRVTINSIGAINTAEQTFDASVICNLYFGGISDSSEVAPVQEFIDLLGVEKKIGFLGFKAVPQEKFSYYALSKAFRNGHVVYDYAIRMFASGTFSTEMDLKKFPFDSQDLTITVTCDMPNVINFIEHYGFPSYFTRDDFRLGSTFAIPYNTIVFTNLTYSHPSQSNSGYQYPKICFSLKITRKSDYYIYNIALPVGFISGLSLLSMSVNDDGSSLHTSERLSITLILLLTLVAYKLVVAESLPKLSYQTYLDYYLWWTFAFILFVALENVFYPLVLSDGTGVAGRVEAWIVITFGGVFLFVNLFLGLGIMLFLKSREERRVVRVRVESGIREAGKHISGTQNLAGPSEKFYSLPTADALQVSQRAAKRVVAL
jgi:hypothetical protein